MSEVVVHCGLPAAGKSTAARLAAAGRRGAVLLDKDEVNPYESVLAAMAGKAGPFDRDSRRYQELVYPVTMSILGELVCGALRAGAELVIVDAPLLRETTTAAESGVALAQRLRLLWGLEDSDGHSFRTIWHDVDGDTQRERMRRRGLARDELKLADWEGYRRGLMSALPGRGALRTAVDEIVSAPVAPLV